jgi:predicted RNA polymerase sigma factor
MVAYGVSDGAGGERVKDAPEGFADLFEREFGRLVRNLRAVDDAAEDAVQEAFVQAYVRWNRVGQLDDPAGWVRRVAVIAC